MARRGRGRPPLYPPVDQKPDGGGLTPAEIGRIVKGWRDRAKDDRIENEIGRLCVDRELTQAQGSTATRIQDIYRRWRHLRRLRINPKSANLEHGFSGGADVAEERMSWEQLSELEAQVRAANEDYAWLSGQLNSYRLDERRVIEDLCSDNGSVVPTPDLPLLRSMLNRFGMALARRSRGQNHGETPTARHIQAGEKEAMVAATVQRRGDPARKAVEEVLKQHGIAEEQTRQMVRDFLDQRELQEAIAARELYRTRAGLSTQQP